MYKIRIHRDGFEVYRISDNAGLFTFADLIAAINAARAANRESRK
jgi:hypothetical protein